MSLFQLYLELRRFIPFLAFQTMIYSKKQWFLLLEFFIFKVVLIHVDVVTDILVGIEMMNADGVESVTNK